MRKDLEIHINTNDIVLKTKNKYKTRVFRLVDSPADEERYAYAEIDVPATLTANWVLNNGVYVEIPYIPIDKEWKVRIRRIVDDTDYTYIDNPVDGSQWFLVKIAPYGNALQNSVLSELMAVSEKGFYLKFVKDGVQLFSADQMDFNVIPCDRQNANLLLSCIPTNNYRYPLTGVGLIRWINGNMSSGQLTDVLMSEFSDDGMTINNAKFDQDTKQLIMDAKSNGNI